MLPQVLPKILFDSKVVTLMAPSRVREGDERLVR